MKRQTMRKSFGAGRTKLKFNPKPVKSIRTATPQEFFNECNPTEYTIKVVLSGIIRLISALADIINK